MLGKIAFTLNQQDGELKTMATRQHRLREFNTENHPSAEQRVELLCEDHCGTYSLPFACRWADGNWISADSGELIQAVIVGWRERQ
jgi:hypothetical protein